MDKNKEFLGTEKIGKLLFRLAVPTVIAQIVNMLYNIVDRIYIGHIPGEGSAALTGVGVCMPIIMIISAFAALVSSGGAPRASISLGKGDRNGAEKILGNCFLLQLILSAVLTAVLLIWDRNLLLMFGASENTIDYAVAYMDIYAVGTVFVQLTLGLNAFITAQGFAKTGMLTVIIGAAANIALDPLFIFAFDMGVRGAAVATVISQGVSCVWAVCFLLSKKTGLKIRFKNMRLAPKVIAEKRHIYKGVSTNVDFYSGFVYDMLGIPVELYTPIFAVARIVGWSAHRMEELVNVDKIIRPAYQSIMQTREYVPLEER